MNQTRTATAIIQPNMVLEGAGVRLLRSISPSRTNRYDPFLLFDHFAFNDPREGPIRGFPMHPHRGIETVTYMLEGEVNHRDSLGNAGTIGPGDVQWMTSGGGIMHEEMPQRSPEGNIYGFQLWVNLPAALKMSAPRYQEIKAGSIPRLEQEGVTIRIVAGEVEGVRGPVTEIAAQPIYLDVHLAANTSFSQPIPVGHTAVAYVYQGKAEVGGEQAEAVELVVLSDGDSLQVHTPPDSGVRFMLMAGAPFGESIVPYGPFVMNTEEEIQQALEDLRNGTFVKS